METTFVHVSAADAQPGGTPSSFKVTFERCISMPAGARVRVNDVRLINSFRTITKGVNDQLYVLQSGTLHAIELLAGYFNVIDLTKMLSVALKTFNTHFSLVYNANQNSITITHPVPFQILTDNQLLAYTPWTFTGVSPEYPASVNGLLRNTVDAAPSTTFVVPYCLVNPFDTLYLRCKQLSSSHIFTVNSCHDVLCVINVDQPYGQLLTAQTPNLDSIRMGAAFSHKTLNFYVTDRLGNQVNLDSGTLTFTLVFYS